MPFPDGTMRPSVIFTISRWDRLLSGPINREQTPINFAHSKFHELMFASRKSNGVCPQLMNDLLFRRFRYEVLLLQRRIDLFSIR
jgi:hypothetical protein